MTTTPTTPTAEPPRCVDLRVLLHDSPNLEVEAFSDACNWYDTLITIPPHKIAAVMRGIPREDVMLSRSEHRLGVSPAFAGYGGHEPEGWDDEPHDVRPGYPLYDSVVTFTHRNPWSVANEMYAAPDDREIDIEVSGLRMPSDPQRTQVSVVWRGSMKVEAFEAAVLQWLSGQPFRLMHLLRHI